MVFIGDAHNMPLSGYAPNRSRESRAAMILLAICGEICFEIWNNPTEGAKLGRSRDSRLVAMIRIYGRTPKNRMSGKYFEIFGQIYRVRAQIKSGQAASTVLEGDNG